MTAKDIAKAISLLIDSISESIEHRATAKEIHPDGYLSVGYNIDVEDSTESINRRIVIARQLLNRLKEKVKDNE